MALKNVGLASDFTIVFICFSCFKFSHTATMTALRHEGGDTCRTWVWSVYQRSRHQTIVKSDASALDAANQSQPTYRRGALGRTAATFFGPKLVDKATSAGQRNRGGSLRRINDATTVHVDPKVRPLFHRLAQQAVAVGPTPYHQIIATSDPGAASARGSAAGRRDSNCSARCNPERPIAARRRQVRAAELVYW